MLYLIQFDFSKLVPMASVLIVFIGMHFVIRIFWEKIISFRKKRAQFYKQIILGSITATGVIFFIMALPFPESIRSSIMQLVGIIVAAAFSLSSTTFLGNMLAGVMNKAIGSFRIGDFIECNGLFGRVSTIGLFHIEIQTIDRGLTSIPHLIVATNSVKVTRSSGAIVSVECSLGYDVNRKLIERTLIAAAEETGLKDPFVLITGLGDFSVVYKIHGMLEEVTKFMSVTSTLNGNVLDFLHNAGIEIVSPNFMNQRQVGDTVFIPKKERKRKKEDKVVNAEKLIFDKAEQAEEIEKSKMRVDDVEDKIKEMKQQIKDEKSDEVKAKLEVTLERYTKVHESLKTRVEKKAEELDNGGSSS